MSQSPSNVTIPEQQPFTLTPLVCYAPTMISMGGIWKGENPLDYAFPLFLFQLLLIVLTTRATAVILQPLHQPRYLAEIIGGILLGPSVMGQIPNFGHLIFPLRSVLILETMANLGLIYFMFTVGIEIDPSTVRRSGKSLSFAFACIGIPFTLGHLAVFIAPPKLGMSVSNWAFLIFLCVTLSITAFSVLARSLAELKLLNTSLGATALNTAVLVDSFAWILLSLAITLAQNEGKASGTFYTLLSGFAFYLTMTVVMKPAMQWVINRTPEGEEVDDAYACAILVSVLVAAFVSDAIGIHAVTGAFMFGMVVPNGSLGEALIERIEDFVEGLLLPLFFVTSGLKTDFGGLKSTAGAMFVVGMVVTGTVAKVGGCVVVARLYDMTMRDGIAMGLLMNTKGVVEMVLLNIGRDRKLLSEEAFSTLVTLSIVITAVATPLLRYVARPARRLAFYKRRTVLWPKPDDDLRVVLCGYSPRHVPSNLALLDSLNPTKRSPISVLSLHLIELTSRASATTILNSAASKDYGSLSSFVDPSSSFSSLASSASPAPKSSADHVIHTYETYEQHTAGVSFLALTAVSPFASMHRDIFGVAEENHAALIILPFHKQQTVDGGMDATNPAIHTMNQTVLNSAPCSVAVLVDRGLRTASRFPGSARHQVTLLFLGGPDDREAIAVASRMVEHPGIRLTFLRLVAADSSPKAQRVVNMSYGDEDDGEKQRDDDCIGEFRLRYAGYKTVAYRERAVSNAEETVAAIRGTLEEGGKDLYVVGRGSEAESALTAGMTEWSECPELGAIGDLMASTDFGAKVSVLVVQQFRGVKSGKVKAVEAEEGMEIRERYDMCTSAEK